MPLFTDGQIHCRCVRVARRRGRRFEGRAELKRASRGAVRGNVATDGGGNVAGRTYKGFPGEKYQSAVRKQELMSWSHDVKDFT